MKFIPGLKFFAKSTVLLAATNLSPPTSAIPQFFVECHAFFTAKGNIFQDYAYDLVALSDPVAVANGIDFNLKENNIFLSVRSKKSLTKTYLPLYSKLPLVMRSGQSCGDGKCKHLEYEPQNFIGKLVVTYDKENGLIAIKHLLTPTTLLQAHGGCLFTPVGNP